MKAALALAMLGAGHLLPLLLGVAALGIVVLLHELGHFIVAKLSGIRVEVFSIGFPPRLWGFKRGDTEYRLSLVFFGGYVKLAGMEFEEGVDPRGVADGYYASGTWKKLAVCFCGPLMNLISAFLIYSFFYFAGYPVPVNMERTVIGSIMENSPASAAGLLPGDRVIAVNGKPVVRWEEVTKAIVYSTTPAVDLEFERVGRRITQRIVPQKDKRISVKLIGIMPTDIVSVEVLKDSVAQAAGMRKGDFITGVDGETVYSWEQLMGLIRSHEGAAMQLALLRNGAPASATVVPRYNDKLGYPAIGIMLRQIVPMADLEANGLVVYLYRNPFSWIGRNLSEMYATFRGLVMRAVSPRGLAGPIGIIQIMGYSMRAGVRQFLYILGLISVNLAVLNLLPIPVLDGGHILTALVEGIRRKPLSAKAMAVIQNVFMAIFIALMVFVTANDVMRSWGDQITRIIWGAAKQTPTPAPGERP